MSDNRGGRGGGGGGRGNYLPGRSGGPGRGYGAGGGRGIPAPQHGAGVDFHTQKWTPAVTSGGVRALYLKNDGTVDPNEVHKFFESIVPYVASKFSPEYRHIVDLSQAVAKEWPEVEGLIAPLLPPEMEKPAEPEDPGDDCTEREATEYNQQLEAYAKELSKYKAAQESYKSDLAANSKSNASIRQNSVIKRAALFEFLTGQVHPKVLSLLKQTEAGKEAQLPVNLDSLRLVEALRSLAQGKLKSGVENTWRDAKNAYESMKQGDLSLHDYYDRFQVARANFESAADAERLRREEQLKQVEDGDSDEDTQVQGGIGAVYVEDMHDAILRFVEKLNPLSQAAYRTPIEAAAVKDFQNDFLSNTSARFRRTHCATLEKTLASIQERIRDRRENPQGSDLLLLSRGGGVHKGAYGYHHHVSDGADASEEESSPRAAGGGGAGGNKKKTAASTVPKGKQEKELKVAATVDKSNSKCKLCGESGHWWADGKCEQGRAKLAAEKKKSN